MSQNLDINLSPIDEQRFGMRSARAALASPAEVEQALAFCQEQQVKFLAARCPVTQLATAQALEKAGAFLTDTLVYYDFNLAKKPVPADEPAVLIRAMAAGEEETVGQVAAQTFQGYFGHYHADPHLERQKCDEVYTDWAYRASTSRQPNAQTGASEVLVAEMDGRIVGFATLRMNSAEEGEGVLFGVSPEAQGKGIYRSFIVQGLLWCKAQGAAHMVVSTQVTNLAVQKVWVRVGYEPSKAYYTFHKWFD